MYWTKVFRLSSLKLRDIEGFIVTICDEFDCEYKIVYKHKGFLFHTYYVKVGQADKGVLEDCCRKIGTVD